MKFCFIISIAIGIACFGMAEEPPTEVEYLDSSDFELSFVIPGWMANAKGTVTTAGVPVAVDVGLIDILESLEMAAIGGLAGQYGKFGFYLEGLYGELAVGGKTSGQILTSVDVEVTAILAEGYISYRIFEEENYWLDFIAGARYTDLEVGYSLGVDRDGVRAFSQQAGSDIADRVAEIVSDEIGDWLEGLLPPWAGRGSSTRVFNGTSNRTSNLNSLIRDRLNRDINSRGSDLGDIVADSPAVQAAINNYARIAAQSEVDLIESASLPTVDREAIRKRVRAGLAQAEANLSRVIEDAISELLPNEPLKGSRAWVDPFFGFKGVYQLNEQWHLSARGDVGGFGVGSESTYSLYGAVGYQYSERTILELGWRYLYVDYQSGGFDYNVSVFGPFLGIAIQF